MLFRYAPSTSSKYLYLWLDSQFSMEWRTSTPPPPTPSHTHRGRGVSPAQKKKSTQFSSVRGRCSSGGRLLSNNMINIYVHVHFGPRKWRSHVWLVGLERGWILDCNWQIFNNKITFNIQLAKFNKTASKFDSMKKTCQIKKHSYSLQFLLLWKCFSFLCEKMFKKSLQEQISP